MKKIYNYASVIHLEITTVTLLVDFFQDIFLSMCKLTFLSNRNLRESLKIMTQRQSNPGTRTIGISNPNQMIRSASPSQTQTPKPMAQTRD